MNLYPKSYIPVGEVQKFLVIFYIVGTLGFLIPMTKDLFVKMTPYALLLNTYLLAVYHKGYSKRTIIAFSLIYLLGFLIEAVGVKTGIVFGSYEYGLGLGPKVIETPLLIGLNWLFLSYASCSIVDSLRAHKLFAYVLPALMMLCYDNVLEQVAPKMDMWSWRDGIVPMQNYVVWFILALVFTSFIRVMKVDTKNPLSIVLLLCQFVFLTILMLIL